MKINHLRYYAEPQVEFGFGQIAEDCRDGLALFGPYVKVNSDMKIGVVGSEEGVKAYSYFANEINKPVYTKSVGRAFFPGFKTVFGLDWPVTPTASITIPSDQINKLIDIKNLHERTYQLVSLYLEEIMRYLENQEVNIDLWYIVISKEIWRLCRPKSTTGKSSISRFLMQQHSAGQMSLFKEDNKKAEEYAHMYETDSDFHDQMKARILSEKIQAPIQIMIEETLLFRAKDGTPYDDDMKAHLLWTQSTSTYYKLGYLPWKLHDVRPGVCYIGLVFKTLQNYQKRKGYACCAAQMFLDSGDGMVFRGNIGPWLSKDERTYHLNRQAAEELITKAVGAYFESVGVYPEELFIHGRTQFTDEEWQGFCAAIVDHPETNLVGVTINDIDGLRLFKDSNSKPNRYGILRGTALVVDSSSGYLWTKGYIPRLETANHMEIARPLKVSIARGNCDIDIVMRDILCLTKLNYNACIYGDGLPVTLRFSDQIGNILTALKDVNWPARQFKYYI